MDKKDIWISSLKYLLALNFLDLCLTIIGLSLGLQEINPLMDFLFFKFLWAGVLLKFFGMLYAIWNFWFIIRKNPADKKITCHIITSIIYLYFLIICWNLIQITFVFQYR
jgi:hypothetical protein